MRIFICIVCVLLSIASAIVVLSILSHVSNLLTDSAMAVTALVFSVAFFRLGVSFLRKNP